MTQMKNEPTRDDVVINPEAANDINPRGAPQKYVVTGRGINEGERKKRRT